MKVNHVMSQYNHRLTDVELLKSPTCWEGREHDFYQDDQRWARTDYS
jgi:hypothetical protein